jgi:DNA-binding CsgD family transcriptional regulator
LSESAIGAPAAPAGYWQHVPPQARVVELASEELTYQDMGSLLGVAPATVKHHLSKAYLALGVTTRVGAVRWWWEHVELREHTAHREAARQEHLPPQAA